jgi:hypothetical protein
MLCERSEDLAVLGKATGLVLGEDEVSVAKHIELALAARDVLRLDPVRFQLGCETRSPLVIARSSGAVVDLDRHGRQRTPSVPLERDNAVALGHVRRSGWLAASQPGSDLILFAHVLVGLELGGPSVDLLRRSRGGHVQR